MYKICSQGHRYLKFCFLIEENPSFFFFPENVQSPSKHSPIILASAKITFSVAVFVFSKSLHVPVMLSVQLRSAKIKIKQ